MRKYIVLFFACLACMAFFSACDIEEQANYDFECPKVSEAKEFDIVMYVSTGSDYFKKLISSYEEEIGVRIKIKLNPEHFDKAAIKSIFSDEERASLIFVDDKEKVDRIVKFGYAQDLYKCGDDDLAKNLKDLSEEFKVQKSNKCYALKIDGGYILLSNEKRELEKKLSKDFLKYILKQKHLI